MHPVVATTPTQYAFAIGLMIVGPVLAIFGASVQRSRRENPFLGALFVGGASWAGWIASGIVAATLFPGYPRSGTPTEPIAMLFVLPGLLTGAVALRALQTRKRPVRPASRRRRIALAMTTVIAVVISVFLVWAHVRMTAWPAHRELPSEAEILEERAYEDGFLSDFEYVLRARMSEESFREWMRRLHVDQTDAPADQDRPLDAEADECGRGGSYADGVGTFYAWCN